MWVLIFFLLQMGQGAVVNEAEILTATQDAELIYSECSNMSTQKLKLEKFQSLHELSFDFVEIVKDITRTETLAAQQQNFFHSSVRNENCVS